MFPGLLCCPSGPRHDLHAVRARRLLLACQSVSSGLVLRNMASIILALEPLCAAGLFWKGQALLSWPAGCQ
jgi:hypothetical protein